MKRIAQKSNDTLYFQLVEQASLYENYGQIKLRFERLFFQLHIAREAFCFLEDGKMNLSTRTKKKAKVSQALSI